MIVALKRKFFADFSVFNQNSFHASPERISLGQHGHAAQNVEAVSCAGQSHANSVVGAEETDRVASIVPHQRKNNDVVFFALKAVDHRHPHLFQPAPITLRAFVFQLIELCVVGSQYGDAMRRYVFFSHQVKRQMKNHKHFMEIVKTFLIFLFSVIVMIKKHLNR